MQVTLRRSISFEGIGVHGGSAARATVKPAPIDAGITFVRSDVLGRHNRIPALYSNVVDTRMCTVLANEAGVSVGTVEHLMSALAGLGVTNAEIEIDGPEIPIMDGSAAPFVDGLCAVGVADQTRHQKVLKIERRIEVVDGDRSAALEPCDRFEMDFRIDFDEPAIGRQSRRMRLINGAFVEKLCRARTFGRLCEVEQLRKLGLARGGSLDNAIVVDGARILNDGGLRYRDEFVRHKMLDAVGDLALAGGPILGRYIGVCAGHEMTNRLLRAAFAEPDAVRWVERPRDVSRQLGVDTKVTVAA